MYQIFSIDSSHEDQRCTGVKNLEIIINTKFNICYILMQLIYKVYYFIGIIIKVSPKIGVPFVMITTFIKCIHKYSITFIE